MILAKKSDGRLYRSNNHGETWNPFYSGNFGLGFLRGNERGIQYLDVELNDGVWYQTNVTTRVDLIVWYNGYYYSVGNGCYYSDNGHEWTFLAYGEYSGFDTFRKDYGILYGEYGAWKITKRKKEFLFSLPTVSSYGNPSAEKVNIEISSDMSVNDIERITVNLLNDYFIPYIWMKYSGRKSLVNYSNPVSGVKNEPKRVVRYKDDILKVYRSISPIDWYNDVGMMDIGGITLENLLYRNDNSEYITEEISRDGNDDLAEYWLDDIEKAINKIKKSVVSQITSDITNFTGDGLKNVIKDSSSDDLQQNIEMYNFYANLTKQSSIDQLTKLYDVKFSMDDYTLISIGNDALLRTVKNIAGKLKYELMELRRKATENKKTEEVNIFDLNIKFDYQTALSQSISNYINMLDNTMVFLNDNNDKDLIQLAVSDYNIYCKSDLVQDSIDILLDIKQTLSDNFKADYYKSSIDNLNFFLGNIYNSVVEIQFKDGKIITNDDGDIKYKEVETGKIDYKHFKFMDYDFNDYVDRAFNYIYKQFSTRLGNIELKSLSEDTINNGLETYTDDEKSRTQGYLSEIQEKLIDRCKELIVYVFKNLPSYDYYKENFGEVKNEAMNNLKKWIYKYYSDDRPVVNDYNLPLLEKSVEPKIERFTNDLYNEYSGQIGVL